MKLKPAVKNELFLEDVLTLEQEDIGVTLRLVMLYEDMLQITVPEPPSEAYKNFHMLFTKEQLEQVIKLYQEWKDE